MREVNGEWADWFELTERLRNRDVPVLQFHGMIIVRLNVFSVKRFSVFDQIQIIVAVACDLRNIMEPNHNTGQIPFQI